MCAFNGLGLGLGNLSRLSSAQSRSISAENPTGGKGQGGRATEGTGADAARDLGLGWKVSPSIKIAPRTQVTLADIAGSGAIQHIWMTTHTRNWRRLILRCHWDGDERPAPWLSRWVISSAMAGANTATWRHCPGLYRWHIMDPIRFQSRIRVTIQALGWRAGRRYLPLQDDIASTAFWYQRETSAAPAPTSLTADVLEVI